MAYSSSSSSKNLILPVSDPPPRGDDSLFKGSAMTKRGAYAAISYMGCAVLLVMFNKAALSSYNFPSANVITLFQMICSCSFLYAMRRWKIISFTIGEPLNVSETSGSLVPYKTLVHTLPLALSYLLYMLVSMESVRGVNVPMYTTLRRTTVVFTMIVEYLLSGQKYSSSIVSSVALIVLGAFIAGARDLSFDTYGYAVVLLANITTAIYLATIARIGKSSGLNSFGLMWCNGCDASFLHNGILLKLQCIFEHNSQFSSHTDNVR
ncbi:UAA transporter [Macleaya cordata]|uniref:UAA transporter n=1 Tax=Macleaya cordata TaxID=56857 RepID=A0A200PNU1_MACCD|nr:UAA transporter [Macleaya cordata]